MPTKPSKGARLKSKKARAGTGAEQTTVPKVARKSSQQVFFIGAVVTLGAFTIGTMSGVRSASTAAKMRPAVAELHDPAAFPDAWQTTMADASLGSLEERRKHLQAQVAEKRAAAGAPKQADAMGETLGAQAAPPDQGQSGQAGLPPASATSPPITATPPAGAGFLSRVFGQKAPTAGASSGSAARCQEDLQISDECRNHVEWAMEVGINDPQAPEWYPDLHPGSSFKEFQAVFVDKGCPMPCLDSAGDGPAQVLPPLPPLPPPLPDKQHDTPDLVVLVQCGRDSRRQRDAVRETWQNGYSNVFFIVGAKPCPIPPFYRIKYTCDPDPKKKVPASTQVSWDRQCIQEQAALLQEQREHPELILVPMVDVYRSLPRKLKESYRWALANTNAKWIMKCDDDQYLRVGLTTQMFQAMAATGKVVVAGGFGRNLKPHRSGKWAELKYKKAKLPPFPSGGAHTVTRELAQWIVDNDHQLVEYQGEDSSLGIWLDEAPWTAELRTNDKFVTHDGKLCMNPTKFVIGHDVKPPLMKRCFQATRAATVPSNG